MWKPQDLSGVPEVRYSIEKPLQNIPARLAPGCCLSVKAPVPLAAACRLQLLQQRPPVFPYVSVCHTATRLLGVLSREG